MPGIGPTTARRIVETRRDHSINSMEQLKKMRVVLKRAAPFIWFKGMLEWEKQLSSLRPSGNTQNSSPPLGLAETVLNQR